MENNTATFAHTHTQQNKKPRAIIFYLNHDACLDKLLFHRGADVTTRSRGEWADKILEMREAKGDLELED